MVEFPRPEVYPPLQIAFGDVVSSYSNLDFSVIVNLGEGGVIFVSRIFYIKRHEALGSWGTATRDDIREIVGHWKLPKILRSTKLAFGDEVFNNPAAQQHAENVYSQLRTNFRQKPRTLSM